MLISTVLFFFSFWFLLSILYQFNFLWFKKILQFDLFHLLPMWTFFAPNPGTIDYNLFFREKLENDELSEWARVFEPAKRDIFSMFWHPQKRKKKYVIDLTRYIIQSIPEIEPDIEKIRLNLGYISILNYLSSRNASSEKQFIITQSFGFISERKPILILRSEFHLV